MKNGSVHNDPRSKNTQTLEELERLEGESVKQKLPEEQAVFKADSIKDRARKRGVSNLPDRLNPPMGFDPEKAFDNVYPFVKIPFLHPNAPEDNITFGFPDEEPNKIYFGDNLHVLRALKSNSVDLIYIDPPFFSGRNYNQIWGDDNEVRTFYDIWEDGLPSYLVWLNSRLWEMKRVLKDTGSIYVHCDWHASHYIKCEMDKIFGYANFLNEIVWSYKTGGVSKKTFAKKHDIILMYGKTEKYKFNVQYYKSWQQKKYNFNEKYPEYFDEKEKKYYHLAISRDVWEDVNVIGTEPGSSERIGYPTQKPEALLDRIIKSSSNKGDVVADFFMGGGTTLAVAMKLGRKFVGCDISRVAASVTLDRVIKVGEDLSGQKSSLVKNKEISLKKGLFDKESFQLKIQTEGITEKTPDIKIYYLGVYPVERFGSLSQEQFEEFILACYGTRRFTGEGKITGVMNSQTNVLVGYANTAESVKETELKQFVADSLRLRYQENSRMKLKVLAWTFPPRLQKYVKTLENYFFKQNIVVDIELIPINSQLFRKRILEHYQDAQDSEFLLLFVTSPSTSEIRYKKISELTYEFEAVGARSNNLDGYLINCQWDFDFSNGLFSEPEFSLMREVAKSGKHVGKYIAVLKCQKKFEKSGKYLVACRIQDNMGSETIKTLEIEVS